MSIEPFNRLVRLTARAFYDDVTFHQAKEWRSDNRGICVIVLDALTRRQWVREEDLAKDLKFHAKQLRRILKFFEDEKFVNRDYRKESAKGAKIFSAAVEATADGHPTKEGGEKLKMHTHSYCCLDYAQIHDVVKYRLPRMKKRLKDELENKIIVQVYICPKCNRRYNALDALQLISPHDEYFHCENCNGELVIESEMLANQGAGNGEDNRKKQRREKLNSLLQKMLKPLVDQLARVKDLPVPEFGNLRAWEACARAAGRGLGEGCSYGLSNPSQGGFGGTLMPFLGDIKVEVDFTGSNGKEDVKSEAASKSVKALHPPWMMLQGMNLTKEQRGEVKEDAKMDSTMAPSTLSDDKKSTGKTDDKINIQEEYVKAYFAALLEQAAKKQPELLCSTTTNGENRTSSMRQVGMKFKREENEGEEDIDWEESHMAGNTGNGSYKVNDLNVQTEASGEDEDENDIDWEEG